MSVLDNNYLEAIPNTSAGSSDGPHRDLARTRARHLRKPKYTATRSRNFNTEYIYKAEKTTPNELTKEFNGKIQSIKFSLDKNEEERSEAKRYQDTKRC